MIVPNIHLNETLSIKPEYQNNSGVSGNKFRKLKYNLEAVNFLKTKTILTFGGAFSNHIAAVAQAGKEAGINTIGIIRGEELAERIHDNPTLKTAQDNGMHLKFVSRSQYRDKESPSFLDALTTEFRSYYYLPEGGTNALAVKGCEEILGEEDKEFDIICCPVGTGGTLAGLINSSSPHQKILGFSALKGDFLNDDISKFAKKDNWNLITDYHFGGYAKINHELISFINRFKLRFDILLDPVYTGKMMFGIFDMLKKGRLSGNEKILAIHTGGLQGIAGMNLKLKQRELPIIKI